MKEFEQNQHPNKEKIMELSKIINLSDKATTKWFTNKRYKYRLGRTQNESNQSKIESLNTSSETTNDTDKTPVSDCSKKDIQYEIID